MPNTTDILQSIRDEVADLLATDAFFWETTQAPVLSRIEKQKLNELKQAINTKIKLAIAVMIGGATPMANGKSVHGPFYGVIEVDLHCYENRNLNDSGYSVEQLSDRAAAIVQHHVCTAANAPLVFVSNEDFESEDGAKVVRVVKFQTSGGLQYTVTTTGTPIILDEADLCTITGPVGAAIYYTTDGTRPRYYGADHPDNNGTLYSAPFSTAALADGAIITARAYKTGERASAVYTVTHA